MKDGDRVTLSIALGDAILRPTFDPENDAIDCELVINWLNAKGWQVEVHWQHSNDPNLAAGAFLHTWDSVSECHLRDDFDRDRWKEAVCNHAVKVIEFYGSIAPRRQESKS